MRLRVLSVIVLLMFGCAVEPPEPEQISLRDCLDEHREDGQIDLADCYAGTWTRVAFIGQYSDLDKALGRGNVPRVLRNQRVEVSDGVALIVYLDGERVVAWGRVERNKVDYRWNDHRQLWPDHAQGGLYAHERGDSVLDLDLEVTEGHRRQQERIILGPRIKADE